MLLAKTNSISDKLVGNWILTFCQLHRVTSGQTNNNNKKEEEEEAEEEEDELNNNNNNNKQDQN